MLWIAFTLLATLLWAVVNIFDKYTMSKLVDNPMVPIFVLGIVGLAAAIGIYITYDFPLLSPLKLLVAFLSGAFYLLTMLCYYQAMKRDEVSRIIPLYYLAPVFILLMARALLHEVLNNTQYFGMAFLVFGAGLISAPYPFKLRFNKAAGFMILAALCYAVNQILTKWLLKEETYWVVFATVRMGFFICLVPAFFWGLKGRATIFQSIGYRAYGIMTMNQLLNLAGVLSITCALSYGYVTLVNALTAVQPCLVLMLATILSLFFPHLLKEERSRSIFIMKSVAIAIILCGTLMVG